MQLLAFDCWSKEHGAGKHRELAGWKACHYTSAKTVIQRIREKRWPGQQQQVTLPNGDVELYLKLTSLVELHPSC